MTKPEFLQFMRSRNPKLFAAERLIITTESLEQLMAKCFDYGYDHGRSQAPALADPFVGLFGGFGGGR